MIEEFKEFLAENEEKIEVGIFDAFEGFLFDVEEDPDKAENLVKVLKKIFGFENPNFNIDALVDLDENMVIDYYEEYMNDK